MSDLREVSSLTSNDGMELKKTNEESVTVIVTSPLLLFLGNFCYMFYATCYVLRVLCYVYVLEFRVLRRSWKRNRVADILHAG